MIAVLRIADRLLSAFGRLAGWLALIMVCVIVTDVVLRRWFSAGSTQLQELEWHLHGALFLLALGWAYLENAHVRIEVLAEKWPLKVRAYIEITGIFLLLIPYVGSLLWFGTDYFAYSLAYSESSPSPSGLPARYIIKGLMVFGFALLGLAGLVRLGDLMVFLFGPLGDRGRTRFVRQMKTSQIGDHPS